MKQQTIKKQQAAKRLVPESYKTKKTREKLQRHWSGIEKMITPQALQEKIEEMHRWIARHAQHRIPLREKRISLFDENQHAAKFSPRVKLIARRLSEDMQKMADLIHTRE